MRQITKKKKELQVLSRSYPVYYTQVQTAILRICSQVYLCIDTPKLQYATCHLIFSEEYCKYIFIFVEDFRKYLVNELVNFNRYRILNRVIFCCSLESSCLPLLQRNKGYLTFQKFFSGCKSLLLYFLPMKLELLNIQVMSHNCLCWIAPGRQYFLSTPELAF